MSGPASRPARMERRPMHGLFAAAAALVLACVAALSPLDARAEAAAAEVPAESVAVRTLWSTLDTLWNARDAERFGDLFAVDASFEFVDRGERLEGRRAIRHHFAQRFPRFAPDVRHRTHVRAVHAIAPGVSTVDGKVEILREGTGDGAEPVVSRTFAIFAVMLRTADGWRIRTLRAYALPAADGPAPASP